MAFVNLAAILFFFVARGGLLKRQAAICARCGRKFAFEVAAVCSQCQKAR
jgi:hypothetical protein